MKYFEKGATACGYGPDGIILGSVFSIARSGDKITLREECDGNFAEEYTKDESIAVLEEAISWIRNG